MEQVILVDENNNEIGTADKKTVHTTTTPLHRAFSLFIFNEKKQLLVTKRAAKKKTFPSVWTNSVCGHVSPGEETIDAAIRRSQEELHMEVGHVHEVSPYRYRFADKNGIVENEICPIFIGFTHVGPIVNKNEVEDWKWIDWKEFIQIIQEQPGTYSPWSEEEAIILQRINPELLG